MSNVTTARPVHSYHHINTVRLLTELSKVLESICTDILYPPHLFHQTGLLPTNLFDSLLCLDDDEFRFLPLWVPGGNDDGTGGVFNDMIPDADPESAKFVAVGGGRLQTRRGGRTTPQTDVDSSIEDLASQAISTVGKASKVATDGTETVKSLSTIGVRESSVDATRTAYMDNNSRADRITVTNGNKMNDTEVEFSHHDDDHDFDDEVDQDGDGDGFDDQDSDADDAHYTHDKDEFSTRLEPLLNSTVDASSAAAGPTDKLDAGSKGKGKAWDDYRAKVEDDDGDDSDFVLL